MRILTFDIEDWFHLLDISATASTSSWAGYESRIHEGVDRLIEATLIHNYKATFFCLGWVAEKYPDVIRRIDEAGFEVASHSHTHQLAYQQSPAEFGEDVRRSIFTLEDIIGKKVKSFRAPGFSIIPGMGWAFDTLISLGIEYDSSIFPASRGHGGFSNFGSARPAIIECNNGVMKEFPINLGNVLGKQIVFSGGGYFRLLPYSVIQRLTSKADYLMTYFHPRDFDAEQPVLELPLHRRFKSYVGLKGSYTKFQRWLSENHFIDLRTASENVDWERVKRIKVE